MCGIVGIYLKTKKFEKNLGKMLSGMLNNMESRGPDSAGFAIYKNENDKYYKYSLCINKINGKINFKMTSKDIHNLVRALSKPYIGAHINYKNKDIIVWRTKIIKFQKQNIEPGKVLISNKNSITVKSADGAIEIIESEFVKFPKKGEYL